MERFVALLLLAGCGVSQSTVELGPEEDDLSDSLQELAVRSPTDRVIVWQQNIEAMKAAKVPAYRLTNAMLGYAYRPDIVVLQEAWQRVLCGAYLSEGAGTDPDVDNYKKSETDARGLARGCRLGRAPLSGSVLAKLGNALWGGAANAAHRRPFNEFLGSQSRTGVTVVWDATRFTLEDDFEYDDADVPGCSTVLESYKRVAVLLRDTRRTADKGDDVLIGVASAHYGSACMSANNTWVADQMTKRWSSKGLKLRMLGGDFNARVDETSASYTARRAELTQGSWYRAVLKSGFVDPVKEKHPDLCGQWTYPAVSSCAAKTACAETCTGWGIGGKLDRLDYLFVSGAARIISAETDDVGAIYADHKAVRVSIGL